MWDTMQKKPKKRGGGGGLDLDEIEAPDVSEVLTSADAAITEAKKVEVKAKNKDLELTAEEKRANDSLLKGWDRCTC